MTKQHDNTAASSAAENTIGAAADRWSERLASGSLSPDEARAFNTWIASNPLHEEAFQAAQLLRRELARVKTLPEYKDWIRPTWRERLALFGDRITLGAFRQRGSRLKWSVTAGGLVAAVCALMIFVALPPGVNSSLKPVPDLAEVPPPVETEIAEVRDLELPDGSIVTIGAASSVQVAYSDAERRVVLTDGEAFFDVKRDPNRPFLVIAENTVVRVLGTKFDVSLAEEAVDIAVSEGRVEVIRPREGEVEIREEDVKHVLTAGQKVTTPLQGRVEPVQTVEVEDVAAWRRGELVWADTPLSEIVRDLNRYSEDGIELRATQFADEEYTLSVNAADIPRAVNLIAASLELEVREKPGGGLVLQ